MFDFVRLHYREGTLWYGDDREVAATASAPDGLRVIRSGALPLAARKPAGIRLLGLRCNAPLIMELCRTCPETPLWIGSPAICPTMKEREDPEAVLRRLLQLEPTSMLHGHWHRATRDDYVVYGLVDAVDRCSVNLKHTAESLLLAHPAGSAFTYLAGTEDLIDVVAACQLLAEIVDPRWYRHPIRPHRTNRLRAYLGLRQENARWLLAGGSPGRNARRAAVAVRTWYNAKALEAFRNDRCNGPENFPWKIFHSQRTPARGLLRATERVLGFVVQVWMRKLAHARHYAELVDCPYLRPDEHAAYLRHLRQAGFRPS